MSANRSLLALPLLCLTLALGGCENMDPAYWIPDNKKKLPGERREVFPGGVPGVTQGVPPELIKGAQPPQDTAAPQEPQQPVATERPRPKKVARPIQPPPEQQQQQQPQQRPAQQQTWPSPQQQQQQQQQPAASAWPSPPASGTFTR